MTEYVFETLPCLCVLQTRWGARWSRRYPAAPAGGVSPTDQPSSSQVGSQVCHSTLFWIFYSVKSHSWPENHFYLMRESGLKWFPHKVKASLDSFSSFAFCCPREWPLGGRNHFWPRVHWWGSSEFDRNQCVLMCFSIILIIGSIAKPSSVRNYCWKSLKMWFIIRKVLFWCVCSYSRSLPSSRSSGRVDAGWNWETGTKRSIN